MSGIEGKVVAITGASNGIGAEYVVTDVRRRADVADLVALARKRFGRLDVLVSNAGVMPISPLDELRVDDWDRMIDVNVRGVLHGIAAALPVFREQGAGHFVHVASTAGFTVRPTMAVYAGTKFAVRAISEGLRQEAGDKLRVTVISPGMTATNSDSITDPDVLAGMAEYAMPPDAVARAIAYAIGQPAGVDVGEVVIRPTAQA
jgi:NADP-dependent 3-hydroxy acid dehydrogenase YdfG